MNTVIRLARVPASAISGVDYSFADAYGNSWYHDGTELRYGKDSQGLLLIFR